MLICTKDGEPLLVPADVSAEAAAVMIESGDAFEVTALRIWKDIRFRSEDVIIAAFEGAVLRVPRDMSTRNAKLLIEHIPNAVEPATSPERFRPILDSIMKGSPCKRNQ